MKKKYVLFPYIIISIVGCSTTPQTDTINHFVEATTYSYIYCKPKSDNCSPNDETYYLKAYNSTTDPDKQKDVRNRIISEQMRLIDEEFREYEKKFTANVDIKNFAVHIASIGLSSAATLVGGASTKAIISAIDTGLKSTNTNFDSDILQNKAQNIIKNQMYKDRSEKSLIIKANMKADCKTYTLEEAIRELLEYRYAGLFDRALTNLETQTASYANKQIQNDATIPPGSQKAVDAVKLLTSDSGEKKANGKDAGVLATVASQTGNATGASDPAVNAGIGAAAKGASNGDTPAETGAAVENAMKAAGAKPAAAKATGEAVSGAATALTSP
jgi:hypothetical protein